ncbi:hypothetical protein [Actinomadura alba]|uniref:Uncharacterized protein n=1 Tax=Actinomadura alba TaxID=406431 RepID=A0ABR7LJS6_9ACTN|nr:hypothetical protein [Actinomadura alba]MBC6464755.1 hypothetical protein [Actinomadura alba]
MRKQRIIAAMGAAATLAGIFTLGMGSAEAATTSVRTTGTRPIVLDNDSDVRPVAGRRDRKSDRYSTTGHAGRDEDGKGEGKGEGKGKGKGAGKGQGKGKGKGKDEGDDKGV